MTSESRQNLKNIATICEDLSRKKGKIPVSDIKKIAEKIFNIIQNGDLEITISQNTLSFAYGLIKRWLK